MKYFLALVGLAYLLGSIPCGLVVARLMGGPDPRQAGSGNLGAANLFRLMGRQAGLLTFLGDTLKGTLPVLAALYWLPSWEGWRDSAVAAVGLAAVLGHIFPIYLNFKGGKAVATVFGVVAALPPGRAQSCGGVCVNPLPGAHLFRGRSHLRLAVAPGGRAFL